MEGLVVMPEFWEGKRVLITGHTGFKGVWATRLLVTFGAEVHGLALPPDSGPSLFAMLGEEGLASSTLGDMTDREVVARTVAEVRPQFVLHMAAQPLVRRSYREPVETFATNVMGTVHLLDSLRERDGVEAVLVVTTDKVYENKQGEGAFAESDRLGGYDPYAASKVAAEVATAAFNLSYFSASGVPLATARAGNVIGGGDFSENRLIPDIVRAEMEGVPLKLRNPQATRPWQHVLDCLAGYFFYIQALSEKQDMPRSLNFGPTSPEDNLTVAQMQATFSSIFGADPNWERDMAAAPQEMDTLAINADMAQRLLGWKSCYSPLQAIRLTAEWYRAWRDGADPLSLLDAQIASFVKLVGKFAQ